MSCTRGLACSLQMSVSAQCQLLGVGLCGTIGHFTVSLEVTEVTEVGSPSKCTEAVFASIGSKPPMNLQAGAWCYRLMTMP